MNTTSIADTTKPGEEAVLLALAIANRNRPAADPSDGAPQDPQSPGAPPDKGGDGRSALPAATPAAEDNARTPDAPDGLGTPTTRGGEDAAPQNDVCWSCGDQLDTPTPGPALCGACHEAGEMYPEIKPALSAVISWPTRETHCQHLAACATSSCPACDPAPSCEGVQDEDTARRAAQRDVLARFWVVRLHDNPADAVTLRARYGAGHRASVDAALAGYLECDAGDIAWLWAATERRIAAA